MYDSFKRRINYLRISVTDRCNLRCTYCMPEEGIVMLPHSEILSFEEITEIVRQAARLGITKVRITGGEPLVRKGIPNLIKMINAIPGIEDLSLTTNGLLLQEYALQLKEAGLKRINISLDTLDQDKFRELSRGGDLQKVLDGIAAAKLVGLNPIKLNCVIKQSNTEDDARAVAAFGEENGYQVRYIHTMSLENGHFSVVEGGEGGHCASCNRLRLTANGKLKPCLFDDIEFDIRALGIEQALALAVGNKPRKGSVNTKGHFYNIGG
jgi:cyclic pyranopterin phosphate synthase